MARSSYAYMLAVAAVVAVMVAAIPAVRGDVTASPTPEPTPSCEYELHVEVMLKGSLDNVRAALEAEVATKYSGVEVSKAKSGKDKRNRLVRGNTCDTAEAQTYMRLTLEQETDTEEEANAFLGFVTSGDLQNVALGAGACGVEVLRADKLKVEAECDDEGDDEGDDDGDHHGHRDGKGDGHDDGDDDGKDGKGGKGKGRGGERGGRDDRRLRFL